MVDQRDTATPNAPVPGAGASLPVSTRAQRQHTASTLPDPDQRVKPRGLALGRQRSGSLSLTSAAAQRGTTTAPGPPARPPKPPVVVGGEAETVEHTNGYVRPAHQPSLVGAGPTSAHSALRMSVNAVVVGLSPWRWFGSPSGGGADAGQHEKEPHGADDGLREAAVPGSANTVPQQGTAGDADGCNKSSEAAEVLAAQTVCTYSELPAASLDAIQTVRDTLTWRHPWHTCRVFGAGLYLAICVRQLVKGHDLLQPSTALLALCFLLLLRNAVREALARYRRAQQQGFDLVIEEEDIGDASGDGTADQAPSPSPQALAEAERRKAALELQLRVEGVLRPVAIGAARYGAALVVLGAGLLSGRRAITTALVAALLWLGMVVGELRVMSQPTFWLLCYVVAFTVPAAYSRCRRAMDAGVEAALRFVVRTLMGGSRGALLASGAVAAVLMAVVPLNFVLRASLAGSGAFAVLLWQSPSSTAHVVISRKEITASEEAQASGGVARAEGDGSTEAN